MSDLSNGAAQSDGARLLAALVLCALIGAGGVLLIQSIHRLVTTTEEAP